MKPGITNVVASVRARLLNRAKAEGRSFEEMLQYYAMERFLYRLSRSGLSDQFVLKGALMLQLWGGPSSRATKDIDLGSSAALAVEDVVALVQRAVVVQVEDDGVTFDPGLVVGEEIRLAAHYRGTRVRCEARLGNARVAIQVDVGYGDVITPAAQAVEYPVLLDFDAPRLLATTPETAIAEKLEAMVVLDMANTRMKDFLDVWHLAQNRAFDGTVLAQAIAATFRRRRTPLPTSVPAALTPAFHSAPAKQAQWRAYLRKGRIRAELPPLPAVVAHIESFVMPVVAAVVGDLPFEFHWSAGGPWMGGVQ